MRIRILVFILVLAAFTLGWMRGRVYGQDEATFVLNAAAVELNSATKTIINANAYIDLQRKALTVCSRMLGPKDMK